MHPRADRVAALYSADGAGDAAQVLATSAGAADEEQADDEFDVLHADGGAAWVECVFEIVE